jgi:hypothetical protein
MADLPIDLDPRRKAAASDADPLWWRLHTWNQGVEIWQVMKKSRRR